MKSLTIFKHSPLFLITNFIFGLLVPTISWAACDQTLSPGANVISAVSNAANGSTICLNSGNYGAVNLYNMARTGYVTLSSLNGIGAIMSPQIGNSNYIRLDHMTLTDVLINNHSANIQLVNSVFQPNQLGLAIVDSSKILVDNVDFTQVNQLTWTGRINLNNATYSTISNCKIAGVGTDSAAPKYGAADGIMVIGNSANNTIGPNNWFTGILQSLCDVANPGSHCDAIQFYGAGPYNLITGNYFENGNTFIMSPDGATNVTVTNNVFNGAGVIYDWKLQFGSADGVLFEHNTLINAGVTFDSKTGNPASSNILAKNNIVNDIGIKTSGGSGCSPNCVFDHNLFGSSGISSGTNNLIGAPSFIGGASPSTFAGFQLTTTSLGYKAATDGNDIGTNYFGTGTIPLPTTPSLTAPSNLRII
ncbi:MAG: hypothetical protein ACXVB4_05330 [Pseudobdellovibrionaceae bacterium]